MQCEYKLVDQPLILKISTYQIGHFVLWWTCETWEWPVVMPSCAYPRFLRILLCGFQCLLSLWILVMSGSPCEPIFLIASLIYDSMHAALPHIWLCATPTLCLKTQMWVYHQYPQHRQRSNLIVWKCRLKTALVENLVYKTILRINKHSWKQNLKCLGNFVAVVAVEN